MSYDDHCEVLSPTPAQDLALALRALDEADLVHAAHHLGGVLGVHPEQPGIEEAIERWFAAARAPLELLPATGNMYRGTAALRAIALERSGDPFGAAALLLRVQATAPELPFTDRVVAWLAREPPSPAAVEAIAIAMSDAVTHPNVAAALLPVFAKLLPFEPLDELLAFQAVRAARNAGEPDRALAFAEKAHARAQTWRTAIARAMALRALDRLDEAIEAYRDATTRDTQDVSAWLEIGDLSLQTSKIEPAMTAYDEALARAPEHPWALPSRLYISWKYEGDRGARERLFDLATRSAPDSRAAVCARAADRYAHTAWPPSSASVNTAHHAFARKDGLVRLASSYLEAPSALSVVSAIAQEMGRAPPTVEAPEPTEDDPRTPRRPVDFAAWTYAPTGISGLFGRLGLHARAVGPAPSAELDAQIREIATSPYALSGWCARAKAIRRGRPARDAEALVHAMPHPSARPTDIEIGDWPFRWQLAIATLIGAIDSGWEGSMRARALTSLIYGPVDWTTTVAIVVMSEIARTEPVHAKAITETLVAELDVPVTPLRWSCLHEPLIHLLDRLEIDNATRVRIARIRRQDDEIG